MIVISDTILHAYITTAYQVAIENGSFDLRIGQRSHELLTLYSLHKVQSGCFITAFNPLGVEANETVNLAADQRLHTDLLAKGYGVLRGEGVGDDTVWPPEPSYLALGATAEDARILCSYFSQNAVVYAGKDAIPMLLLHTNSLITCPKVSTPTRFRCGTLALQLSALAEESDNER